MAKTEFVVFIDTNTFLHVRDLKDIPWWELEGLEIARRIDVMIAGAVVSELDKHKGGPKKRRRDRSRAALNLIVAASKERPEPVLILREKPVEVRLCLAGKDVDWGKTRVLDRSNPDDQIVAEAIMYGAGTIVFSLDTRPRIKALQNGLVGHEPKEEWMLPEEATEDEEEIKRLKRELEKAQDTKPKILLSFPGKGENKNKFTFRVPVLEPLGETRSELLREAYLLRHPRVGGSVRHHFPSGVNFGLPDMAGERYDGEYDAFQRNVQKYFDNLHKRLFIIAHVVSVPYTLLNDSGVTAEGLRVDVRVEGGYLAAGSEDIVGHLRPPEPPVRRETYHDFIARVPNIAAQLNRPVDPVAFQWIAKPETFGTTGASQCLQFHAKRSVDLNELVWVRATLPAGGEVHFEIGASNLSEPVRGTAVFELVEEKADWSMDWVLARLPDEVRKCELLGKRWK